MKQNDFRIVGFTSLTVSALILAVAVALAKADGGTTDSSAGNSKAAPSPKIEVEKVYRWGTAGNSDADRVAGIDEIIVVKVSNLQALYQQAKCLDSSGAQKANCTAQEIALFFEGRKIPGIVAESLDTSSAEGKLHFRLERNDQNDKVWADLLGAPPLKEGRFFTREVRVSVGLENGPPLPTKVGAFKIVRIRQWRFTILSILLIVLLIFIFMLARRTDLLRDVSPNLAEDMSTNGVKNRRPYSLARLQMAFWFVLVVISFLYLWQITGAYDIITGSILALIGIGSGTALGAAVVESNKEEKENKLLPELLRHMKGLEDKKKKLDEEIKSGALPQQDKEVKQAEVARIERKLDEVTPWSRGFLRDILTDANGYSFHRFQMFIWTIVLGFVFLWSVYKRIAMPQFSETLLALLGISAGTYLGFKIPEKQISSTPSP